jgi:TetR/AcrR family transcriptional repressor of nem operon
MSGRAARTTSDRMLDAAERLVQTRGFNAFSYADVARQLGIRKASLHHHFATKAALGAALVARYRSSFRDALRRIETRSDDAGVRLDRYARLYASVLRRRRMCMCGMLAADVATLPPPMRAGVAAFFAENEAWLTRVLDLGLRRGELRFAGSAASMAGFFMGALEGAMLLARGSAKPKLFDAAARHLLAGVRNGPAGRSRSSFEPAAERERPLRPARGQRP